MITVRFPATLQPRTGRELQIDEPIPNLPALIATLERRIPSLGHELQDPIYNFAVNDELLLHGAKTRALHDGDIVEIVPTISGG